MGDQKNLVIAIALSLAILLGFQFFYELPKVREQAAQQATQTDLSKPIAPAAPGTAAPATTPAAGPQSPGATSPAAALDQIGRAHV